MFFRRKRGPADEIDAAIETLLEERSLKLTHRKDRRFVAGEARQCWEGLSQEERLYYIWLQQRTYATLHEEAISQDSLVATWVAHDIAVVCGLAYIRTYGDDDLGERMDSWGPFRGAERARLEAGEILPGLDGMRAPAP